MNFRLGIQAKAQTAELNSGREAGGNQIYLVTLRPTQLTQASFYKKIKCCKMVFWYFQCWDSTVLPKIRRHFRNKSHSILKLPKNVFYKKCGPKLKFFNELFFRKIRTFFDIENWLWMSRFHDFWCHCAISALQISKKHFATFDFFVKMKLVSTVWVSTSLSKSGESQWGEITLSFREIIWIIWSRTVESADVMTKNMKTRFEVILFLTHKVCLAKMEYGSEITIFGLTMMIIHSFAS